MRNAGAGRFIAVGSAAAERPLANLGAYVISKASLVTLIKTVALENADRGILANLVLPGTMDTPLNRAAMPKADFKKWTPPADVAEVTARPNRFGEDGALPRQIWRSVKVL